MSTNKTWIQPFAYGVLATVATTHILLPWVISRINTVVSTRGKTECQTNSKNSSNSNKSYDGENKTKAKDEIIMDSPTLENRILRKAEGALRLRTSRLIIVVERCTNDHNYSAIMRSAEALGVQHVYIIAPQDCNSTLKIDGKINVDFESLDEPTADMIINNFGDNVALHRSNGIRVKGYTEAEVKDRANHHLFAQRALEWLDVTEFQTTQECIDALRRDGYQIWSTDLSQVAVTLDENGLGQDSRDDCRIIPDKLAIVFGTEAVGCSTQILEASDKRVYLPLRGFADSLNLSVATALVVHQLFNLDPTLIGAMSEEERVQLRRKWYAKLATQRIMTTSEKAKKRRMAAKIKELEEIERKDKFPELNPYGLQPEQKDKLAKLPSVRKELEQLENEVYAKALLAVEDLVLNPPEPIGDMRRHDDHRISYTGKNTKKRGGGAWANMPATNYVKVEVDTSSFFRDRVKARQSTS
mmetsp:Transcript_4311/g.8261  ORF Transcript_4311/g.8261 Transcript_4311/m.8261 type:complete len:471 (+) Transcript_4311:63-1475(+)